MMNEQHVENWFIVNDDKILFRPSKGLIFSSEDRLLLLPSNDFREVSWTELDSASYGCIDVQNIILPDDTWEFIPWRAALGVIPPHVYSLLLKAYTAVRWNRLHQFCGACGTPTVHRKPAFERICPTCHLSVFPRLSPSIIVLIKKGDHVLMARSPHFPPSIFGLIAGFVNPWETAEMAVHREVLEEVGLSIANIAYFGSQPWPFPDSLMLGYTADYVSGEMTLQPDEIEAAGWYRYDNLPPRTPSKLSIAAQMIDSFVASFAV